MDVILASLWLMRQLGTFIPNNHRIFSQNPSPNLIQFYLFYSLWRFMTVKSFKLLNPRICKFLDVPCCLEANYLMWTLSSSAHSSNLEPLKTPKSKIFCLFRKKGLTPQSTKLDKTQHFGCFKPCPMQLRDHWAHPLQADRFVLA